jgi:cytochrome c biogenesis protein CcmG/thiol:disulfide interchange protein DsbE
VSKPSSPRTTLRGAAVVGVLAVLGLLLAGCGDEPVQKVSGGSAAGADKLVACPSTPSRPAVAKALPDVSLPCLGKGPDTRLADLRGPLVINVWAQWCGPCRAEAPYLAELQRKAGDKLKLIGIDYVDSQPDLAVKFAIEQHWDYPQLVDAEKQTQQALRIAGPPLTAFVDAKGAVVYVHQGVLTSQHQLDQLVKDKLGVSL